MEKKKRANPELLKSVELMLSPDYKDRFIAEYMQLKTRKEGLEKMLQSHIDGTLGFTPTCPIKDLTDQVVSMGVYQDILKKRAKIEDIELDE